MKNKIITYNTFFLTQNLTAILHIFHVYIYIIFTKIHMQDKHQMFWGMKSNS